MCNCKRKKFPTALSAASQCGHVTNRRNMKWCARCAAAKGVCPACGKSREGKKKALRREKG